MDILPSQFQQICEDKGVMMYDNVPKMELHITAMNGVLTEEEKNYILSALKLRSCSLNIVFD